MDLMCVGAAIPWDPERDVPVRRKPAKFPFTNLLAAVCWHPDHPVSLRDFAALSPQTQGVWYEWAVAQELWRRRVVAGEDFPENMLFWQAGEHEIDFVLRPELLIEVKRGQASALDFAWFPKVFPRKRLVVITTERFETAFCRAMTLADFLAGRDGE